MPAYEIIEFEEYNPIQVSSMQWIFAELWRVGEILKMLFWRENEISRAGQASWI